MKKKNLGLGTILVVWDNISWDNELSSLTKAELKAELVKGLNLVRVDVDEAIVKKVLSYYQVN